MDIEIQAWTIFYTESFKSRAEAMKREKELKSARGREFIWKMIKEGKRD